MPISVWVKKLDQETEQRALVVMEPVERTVAMVTFNAEVYFNIFNRISIIPQYWKPKRKKKNYCNYASILVLGTYIV